MATKYVRSAGGNWSADATWSTSSGGPADTTKATTLDAVICDANSGNLTVDESSVAGSINCTNYTGTLALNYQLQVNGSCTLVSGMTLSGTSTLKPTGGTFTSAGLTIPNLYLGGDLTVADNVVVSGNFTIGDGDNSISGTKNISVGGDVLVTRATASGITVIVNGTGHQQLSFTGASPTPYSYINFNINKPSGTYNFGNRAGEGMTSATQEWRGTATYTAGTPSFNQYNVLSCNVACSVAGHFPCLGTTGTATLTITGDTYVTYAQESNFAAGSTVTYTGTPKFTLSKDDYTLTPQNSLPSFSVLDTHDATMNFYDFTVSGWNLKVLTGHDLTIDHNFVASGGSIYSDLAGTKANLAITGTATSNGTDYTDINASVTAITATGGSVNNCTAVTASGSSRKANLVSMFFG